ncbi:MAG: hypothetical protein JNL90_15665 [Planctomycetes bacterium]|nr:hypothetical protein [Planctomycetota bacterium]
MSGAREAKDDGAEPFVQVPAQVYALPNESVIAGKSLAELNALMPYQPMGRRLRVRVVWATPYYLFWAVLEQGWMDELAANEDPQDPWRVIGYGPGFHDYKPTPGNPAQPGFPNDHHRKLVEVGLVGGVPSIVPNDQKGGVVSVVVRRPGGDGLPNNLAALLPWLLGGGLLALGFAAGWFVHKLAG